MSATFDMDTAASHIQHGFEGLTLGGVDTLAQLYAVDARFKDPFNDVQGRGAIAHIFTHMFSQVDAPQFAVTALIVKAGTKDGAKGVCAQIYMRWDFSFVARGRAQTIHGATHFELNAEGLITLHRDYWDAAEELYEKIPVLGSILRWLKRRLQA